MEITDRQKKIDEVIEQRRDGVVVLQDIHDPHNAAAIWRTMDAMGWHKVCLIFEKEAVFDPKKMGSASSGSANKWLDFRVYSSTSECFNELHKEGYLIHATVLDKEATTVGEVDMASQKKVAIVMGNEHRGLSEEAVKLADKKIYIPMRGMVQSLNLSVSAAICLYEVERQRSGTGHDYWLSEEEKNELGNRWR